MPSNLKNISLRGTLHSDPDIANFGQYGSRYDERKKGLALQIADAVVNLGATVYSFESLGAQMDNRSQTVDIVSPRGANLANRALDALIHAHRVFPGKEPEFLDELPWWFSNLCRNTKKEDVYLITEEMVIGDFFAAYCFKETIGGLTVCSMARATRDFRMDKSIWERCKDELMKNTLCQLNDELRKAMEERQRGNLFEERSKEDFYLPGMIPDLCDRVPYSMIPSANFPRNIVAAVDVKDVPDF